ncbi:MAG: bifunctional diaminohydroxyphosphoribosylaminopyrimidine deaminase/5-amino-6-(5-phosphoribosylamino)uracil reductase RibD [Alphaproteobacteria bacterium]|nr:bifunctional diaminohydroxyphosphoribosylaminopyrimidine deaminase/5-amino-6-(5-phosphoribosylamino)uracil reductase RibD [Alphaproteobacteria bacterium]
MRAALSLARRGLGNTAPNPAVGCILVHEGRVVGRGWTQPGGRPHAEAVALTQAGDAARGATAYVTLEPCAHFGVTPPCASALIAAGVKRVVNAVSDPDQRVCGKGLKMLRDGGVEVVDGVLRDEAWRANLGFFLRLTRHRPMFTLKLATDRDGQIPKRGAQGPDKWITSPEARRRGHMLRGQHDAVLFGIGTVLDDDPEYTCRVPGWPQSNPVRILVDSKLSIPHGAKLLQTLADAPLWIVTTDAADQRRALDLEALGVTVIRAQDTREGRPTVAWIAAELAGRGLNRVLIETGPALVTAFLDAAVVDEVHWFRAHKALEDAGTPAFSPMALERLALRRQAVLQAGPDALEIYQTGD